MQLPSEFVSRMKAMLGGEYEEFESEWEQSEVYSGMRINTLKKGAYDAVSELLGELEGVPWYKNGYYAKKTQLSGKHPYHMGGLVYFQEPSAMASAAFLPIEKGDFVLDLCAAPGGKATQVSEMLDGSGLLVANEIVSKRAKILLENIQRMGIKNAVVTNETPERLAEKYQSFFDKIIVDAPCSGEGMFKKEPQAATEWSVEHTKSCAARQKNILKSAFAMLKGGGYLVYSTCTFAPEENEGVIDWVLENYPDVSLVPINAPGMTPAKGEWAGSKRDLSAAKRIFPHKTKGEGHFTALLYKSEGAAREYKKGYKCENTELFNEFAKEYLNSVPKGTLLSFADSLYLMPYDLDIDKIRVLQAGLYLGECKKNRFEPSHALCLALSKEDFKNTLETEEPERFFRGETLPCENSGWTAVLYDGYPIGWGKASGGVLKNHFPKYLRF